MAAKYPQEDYVEDGKESKNQPQYGESHTLRTPIEANSIVVDTSDAKEDQNIKAQVAKVYYRSWSEGSDGNSSNSSLNVESSNFAKLFLLSTNICQDVMREIIRKKNPKGPTDADLHNIICTSDTLRQRVQRYTSEDMLLFPKGEETVRYEQLDFSAMYKVARFAIPKQIAPNKSWSSSPNSESNCLMSCIEKLRKFRNDCSHSPRGSIVKSNFESKVNEVTAVILQIETLIHTPNKYSQRVRRLTKASLSPRVSELEAKSVDLEKQIDDLKDSLAKQTEITGLFNEWKTHQQELLDVHRKLEELYKGSSPDTEERLPLLQRNLNVESIGDAMKDQLAASLAEEEFFCETKGTRAAMKHLIENKMVVIVGRKGNGKERLAQHLLFSLMSKSECQTHILDSVNDIRKCFKQKARETEIVLLHDVLIDKATKRTIMKLEEEIFKKSSNRYLIITSLYTTHLAGLSNLVNLSIREFQLSPSEKRKHVEVTS
ncbi:uncharacterized protein LOC117327673 isoform X2 [Pecten maximus]|uniref:uncharacterized protein LOC117327673 isoform X2 n=1 Tax=Pecten maximus TaxID=6579 RepID=UPI001458D8AD|nr:uncharacterized protein LOC117327673 isoform X2 [Pecten maximus]